MTYWQKQVVHRTLELAGDHPDVQLQFLLQRLEAYPDALDAIIASLDDMAEWAEAQADALEAEGRRRSGGAEIVPLHPDGGAA